MTRNTHFLNSSTFPALWCVDVLNSNLDFVDDISLDLP